MCPIFWRVCSMWQCCIWCFLSIIMQEWKRSVTVVTCWWSRLWELALLLFSPLFSCCTATVSSWKEDKRNWDFTTFSVWKRSISAGLWCWRICLVPWSVLLAESLWEFWEASWRFCCSWNWSRFRRPLGSKSAFRQSEYAWKCLELFLFWSFW